MVERAWGGGYLSIWVHHKIDVWIVGLIIVTDVDGQSGADVTVRGKALVAWRVGGPLAFEAVAVWLELFAIVVVARLVKE